MAAFLFARALHKTEEFYLASNVDAAGAFDDLVFRFRLKDPDVWKTCFIQLKHKKSEVAITRSNLTKISDKNFCLFKYFDSYCQIKSEASTDPNLKHCGPFDEFEFVIYTNARVEGDHNFQGEKSDPVSILSSVNDNWKYITFDETVDKDIFGFFEELSCYHDLVIKLDSPLKRGTFVDKEINQMIESVQRYFTNQETLGGQNSTKLVLSKSDVRKFIKEIGKCDFKLYKEFLKKVKIFQSQSNEKSLKQLIEKELQDACKTSPSVANSIYTKFERGFSKWCEEVGNAVWLKKDSELWLKVEKYLMTKIKKISEPELRKFLGFYILFNQQHIQGLCGAIKQNTFLNIVTNSNVRSLQKQKIHQALNILGYTNSLFISFKSSMFRGKEIRKLWPCKWSAVLVIDCDCDCDYEGDVADTLLGILQETVGSEQSVDSCNDSEVGTLVGVLQKYQQKVILISTQHTKFDASFQEKLRNVYKNFEDNCDILDLDEESQNKILERTVNFQGTYVALQSLVGTDPPKYMKRLIDSEVISILLSNKHKLCVGRQLSGLCRYYVPRVLQHHVYLKKDILKLTDNTTTFAVSGLQADELKKYLTAGEKICEFVYDESETNHSFKIVSDYSKIGLSTEWGAIKAHQKVGQTMKSDYVKSFTLGNKNAESDFEESIKNNTVRTVDNLSKSGLSAELENMTSYNKKGKEIKPEEVRYIILGKKNPERKFRELKELCTNVHWIHVEEGSFLWRDSKGNIDIIRRYIDDTKCTEYDVESVIEQSDRTMLLVAEPGMGKSTFLSHMEHEIKKKNTAVWVLRINLNEHTRLLENSEFEEGCIDKCKTFLWSAAHSLEQGSLLHFVEKIFLQAFEDTGKMVIILDGFDEISLHYTQKVNILIREIRDKTASQVFVSSRFSQGQNLEDIVIKLAFRLQAFTLGNQIEFLEQYWNKDINGYKEGNVRVFAEKLLSLCSQNFSDKDGEFTGIPLQTMMLGEAFVREAVEYCSKGELNLPEKFNLLDLFNKFWEKKCEIYFSEKNAMDSSKPKVKIEKESYLRKHMIASLISLFSLGENNDLHGVINVRDLEKAKRFLQSGRAEKFGIIRETTDGNPHFIHRYFAEYFAAKWFIGNFKECEVFISDTLFNSTYEVTRNIFDRMLAQDSEIHVAVLNNDISAIEEFLKNKTGINTPDKGGRTALHLAASYNSQIIQYLMSIPGVEANKPDVILRWTPLRYADRTKSWMAMDILLQNGANADDIVFTKLNIESQEWGKKAMWECASKGYRKLLEFMLNCGTDVNSILEVPENLQEKSTLLHIAAFYGQVGVINILLGSGADVNICNAKKETALHLTAISGNVEIIKILLDKGMSLDLTNAEGSTPLHLSATVGNLEATKAFVERGAPLNNANKYSATPLLLAANKGKLEVFRYLTEIGADINIRYAKGRTALHHAAISGSVEIIKILLDKGMSVDLTEAGDSTPLHISALKGNLEATKLLIKRGAALNNTNKNGHTPLLLAADNGNLEVFRYLTEIGADINICYAKGRTALHHAALLGSVEMIKILLDKGMSVDLTEAEDSTPLHISALKGNLEAVKLLVERSAALNNTNKNGDTPLMLAEYNGNFEVVHYLQNLGADIVSQQQ